MLPRVSCLARVVDQYNATSSYRMMLRDDGSRTSMQIISHRVDELGEVTDSIADTIRVVEDIKPRDTTVARTLATVAEPYRGWFKTKLGFTTPEST